MARRNYSGRIYAGCIHCRKYSRSDELRIANEWIERHWRHCPRTELFTLPALGTAPETAQNEAGDQ